MRRDRGSCQGSFLAEGLSEVVDDILFAESVEHVVAGHDIVVEESGGAQGFVDARGAPMQCVGQASHAEGDEIEVLSFHNNSYLSSQRAHLDGLGASAEHWHYFFHCYIFREILQLNFKADLCLFYQIHTTTLSLI